MPKRPSRKLGRTIVSSPSAIIQATPTNEAIQKAITNRFWRSLNYISIIVFLVVVYSSSVIADYLLFSLIWLLMGEDIARNPFIENAVRYAQFGLILMTLFAALVHGVYSTIGQIKLDQQFSREGEDEK